MLGNVDFMFAKLKDNVTEKIRTTLSKNEYIQKFSAVITDEKWGPLVPEMDELVAMYPQGYLDFLPEMQTRLDNRAVNWRKCYKTLLLIDHLLRNLPLQYLDDLRAFRPTLNDIAQSYNYTDMQGVDRGTSVRERAKKVIEVMMNDAMLHEERQKAEKTRRTLAGGATHGFGGEGVDTRFQGQGANKRYEGHGGGATHERSSSDLDFSTPTHSGPTQTFSTQTAKQHAQEEADFRFAQALQEEENSRVRIAAARAARGDTATATSTAHDDEFGAFVNARSNHAAAPAVPATSDFGEFVSARSAPASAPTPAVKHHTTHHHHQHHAPAAPASSHDDFGAFVQSRSAPTAATSSAPAQSTDFFSGPSATQATRPSATQATRPPQPQAAPANAAPSIDELFGASPVSSPTVPPPRKPDAAMGQMLDLFSTGGQQTTNLSLNQQGAIQTGAQQRAW